MLNKTYTEPIHKNDGIQK